MARFHYASGSEADMFYLTGARAADPFFYLETETGPRLFLNVLELGAYENGRRNIEALPLEPLVTEARSTAGEEPLSHKLALALLQTYGRSGAPVEVSPALPLDMADFLRAKGVRLKVLNPFVPERRIKSSTEVEAIRGSLRKTLKAFQYIEKVLQEARIEGEELMYEGRALTSERLKMEVEGLLLQEGMDNPEGLIISCGAQAAVPHHAGAGILRPHQTIVCDIFPRSRESGYFADMTRTYVKGVPSPQVEKMFEAVRQAQDAGFAAIRAGVSGAQAHEASAQVVRGAGFEAGEKGYIHGLGHGLGLEVHEAPRLGAHSKDILEAGEVVTVEPGLYYPEWGGVRIEDVALVTSGGCEKLVDYPRELLIP